MVKEFNSLKDIQKYYDKDTNTYVFEENGSYIDLVVFNFDLSIDANIEAFDIKADNIKSYDIKADDIIVHNINANDINAFNINANNIKARDVDANNIDAWNIDAYNIKAGDIITGDISACNIEAGDISANNISYWAVCFAYDSIKCKSIKGKRKKSKHFVLDGKLEVEEEN